MALRLAPFVLALAAAGCSAPAPDANGTGEVAGPVERRALAPAEPSAALADDAKAAGGPGDRPGPDYEVVSLVALTSGDNIYLELTRAGAGPETLLCTASDCATWRDGGGLPPALRGKRVAAKFGTAEQVDGSGAVMARGVPAVVDLRVPADLRQRAAAGRAAGDPGPVPLTPGVYVLEGTGCQNPANAAFRVWNGRGLSGSATKDCRATVLSRDGEIYTLRNSCVNTYDGSRTPETLTIRVPDQVHFAVEGNRFRSCAMAEVPDALRKLVR